MLPLLVSWKILARNAKVKGFTVSLVLVRQFLVSIIKIAHRSSATAEDIHYSKFPFWCWWRYFREVAEGGYGC